MGAPLFIHYELANVARTKTRRNPHLRQRIAEQLQNVLEMEITPVSVNFPAVVELALEKNLSAYDASYLVAARQLNAPLLIFDGTLTAAGP